MQFALTKAPDLPDVPLAGDLMKSEEERQLGELIFRPSEITRPLAAPPGVPADRVAVLRKALADTMADPETLADGKRIGVDFTPMTGERIQELMANFYKTPAHVVKRAAELTRE